MKKRRVCAVFYYGKNFHICPTDLPRITGYIAGNILNLILKERSDCEKFHCILSPFYPLSAAESARENIMLKI